MKKKQLEKIIAGVSIVSMGSFVPYKPMEVKSDTHIQSKEQIVFQTNQDKFSKFLEEAENVAAERELEEERLRLEEEKRKLEEEKRIKEEQERIKAEQEAFRISEINRINSVCVELDNVLIPSNLTVDELINVFDYYEYSRTMIELAPIIIEAERTYGINAFVISAIASWESAYNTSYRAVYDFNVLGWGVYSASAEGINASSKYENIMNACNFLREAYLSEDGIYYNGLSTWGISRNYCRDEYGNPSEAWREGVNAIAKNYEWVFDFLYR